MKKRRLKVCPASERVVVDSVFSDRTARLLRAPRKKSAVTTELACSEWGREKECPVKCEALEVLLVKELKGQKIKEGDVFFIHNGRDFFDRKIKRITKVLAKKHDPRSEDKLLRKARLGPEELICSPPDAKWLARQEMKTEFAKLLTAQGVRQDKVRNRVFNDVDKAMKARIRVQRKFQKSTE